MNRYLIVFNRQSHLIDVKRSVILYYIFEGGVDGVVGAGDGEGRYADVAVNRGVAVNRQIVIVLVDAMSLLSPRSVAQIDEIVGEVRAALPCEQNGFCVFGDIYVEYVSVCKKIVFLCVESASAFRPLVQASKIAPLVAEYIMSSPRLSPLFMPEITRS